MATRERPIDRGRARGKRMLREFAEEFRAARREAGLSQRAVANASGSHARPSNGWNSTCWTA